VTAVQHFTIAPPPPHKEHKEIPGVFFLICIVGGGVQTGSTQHVGHLLSYCICPNATLTTTNPTWPDPGLNPGRRGGKWATNSFRYGAAYTRCYLEQCSSAFRGMYTRHHTFRTYWIISRRNKQNFRVPCVIACWVMFIRVLRYSAGHQVLYIYHSTWKLLCLNQPRKLVVNFSLYSTTPYPNSHCSLPPLALFTWKWWLQCMSTHKTSFFTTLQNSESCVQCQSMFFCPNQHAKLYFYN
jgi:hypothetical protein